MLPSIFTGIIKGESETDGHEFKPLLAEIQESPVSPLGRTTFWLVVGTVMMGLAWSYFGEMDVVVSARGKFIPEGQVKTLQPLETGVISKIWVKEGDRVKKGQLLMTLDPAVVKSEADSAAQELSLLLLSKARIQAQLAGKPFPSKESIKANFQELSEMPGLVLDETAYLNQASLYQSSQQGFHDKVKGYDETMARFHAQAHGNGVEQQQTASLLKTALARKNRLSAVRDIITQDDFEKAQSDVQGGENKLKTLGFEHQSLLAQAHQVLQEKKFTEESYRSDLLKELAENQKQTAGLTAKLKTTGFLNHHQEMVAPVAGVVSELMVHTVGGVVTPAQKLMVLVPENTPLQFQATVQNKDIGFVKPGTHALVKVDTFDFQKYGMLTGKVFQVAPDSHEDSKLGPIYKIALIPKDASMGWLWQKDRNQSLSIVSGMTGTAEIKIGQRRILDFLLYPMLRNWEEGMQVR